jgi:hypothetical protein
MAKRYKSNRGMFTVRKEELNILRAGIITKYKAMQGERDLTKSSIEIYDDLAEFFKARSQELGVTLFFMKGKQEEEDKTGVGSSFLRNLLYVSVKDNNTEFKGHHYNFDHCYVFAFGMPRREYLAQQSSNVTSIPSISQLKVIVTSLSHYAEPMEQMKLYMEHKLGHNVQKDVRDMRSERLGTLESLHDKQGDQITPTIYVLGKNHFCNEAFVIELNELRKKSKKKFLANAFVVFLDDLLNGEFNIRNSAGIIKINEFWEEQIKYMQEQLNTRKTNRGKSKQSKVEKEADNKIIESMRKTQCIIDEMHDLVSFLLNEVNTMSYDYFIKHSNKDQIAALLNVKGAA